MYPIKSQASALLSSLFIMTLVAIVATAMSMRVQLDIYRTGAMVTYDKLYLASQAVSFWGFAELNNPQAMLSQVYDDGLIKLYPSKLANLYNQVQLSGALYDLQSRFNLNNLGDERFFLTFINLLNQIKPKMNSKDKESLARAIRHWISAYDLSRGKDEYLSYYIAHKYFPSHQRMVDVSELRLVKNVTAKLYNTLLPFVTVLPELTPININTATKSMLMTLGHGLTSSQANKIIAARGDKGIQKVSKVKSLLDKLDIPAAQITLESQYFLSVAQAKNADLSLTVYTVIKRTKDKNERVNISLVRQSTNT